VPCVVSGLPYKQLIEIKGQVNDICPQLDISLKRAKYQKQMVGLEETSKHWL